MRFIATLLIVTLLATIASPATPAAAMSTAREVALGQSLSQEVDDDNVIITDPFLKNWVEGIGGKLAANRYRTDIDYHFEILDDDSINSFALPGGFVHVNLGLLNFVGSDDELAAVMGHEMGHIERRHMITEEEKSQVLGILIGVLSVLSPIAAALGGYGGDLTMGKLSREAELQADQYGLLLMTRAGYDPQGAVDLMAHLEKTENDGDMSRTDKWMLDHPIPKDRIAHLEGYPELDNPPASQIIADALHDEEEGRWSYAHARLLYALKKAPGNAIATTHLAQDELALKDNTSNSAMRSVAYMQTVDAFGMGDVATKIAKAQAISTDDAHLALERARSSNTDLQTFFNALDAQTNSIPNLGNPKTKGNNLSKTIDVLNHITRDINGTLGDAADVLQAAPALARDNLAPLKEMADSISSGVLSEKTRVLLPYYPAIASSLSQGADQFVSGVDDARAAISMGSDNVHQLSDLFALLNSIDTATSGDISAKDMPRVQASLNTTTAVWDATYAMAQLASDLVYGAQTRTLAANITMLDLYSSSDRYHAYRKALAFRFPGVALPDYQTVAQSGIPAGELGCDAWISYETKEPVTQLLRTEHDRGMSCSDVALGRNLETESMEVAEGLVYEDYVEVPEMIVTNVNVSRPTPVASGPPMPGPTSSPSPVPSSAPAPSPTPAPSPHS